MKIDVDLPPFDQLLPNAPFTELHTRIVDAPIESVWPECLAVTADDVRLLGPLMNLRALPAKFSGKKAPSTTGPKPLLEVFVREGFVLLRRDEAPTNGRASVVFGAVGKFWSITGNAPLAFDSASRFLDFDEPDYAKTVARVDAVDLCDGTTRIETETLVNGTDAKSTRKFAPYWAVIRLPSGAIRRSWLSAIHRRVP